MASIYKRGKTWTANVFVIVGEKRTRKTKSGFVTKTEANKWAVNIENQKLQNELIVQNEVFVKSFEEWYLVFKEPRLETATKQWYKRTLSLLTQKWGDRLLTDISSSDFQKLINEYGDNHVKSSVSHIKNITSAFVRYAVDEDLIKKDFTRNVNTHSVVQSKDKELKFLEVDEMHRLIERVKNSEAITSRMIYTSILSGLRFSEVAGLTHKDFDFTNNTINVNKSWQIHDQKFKETKTKSSNRIVSMPETYMQIAKKWEMGKRFAFEGELHTPPSDNAANKQLKRLLEKDSSKIITFHGLRHTHASYLLSKDISIQYVSERLGHSDMNITLSTYAHLLDKKRTAETIKALSFLDNVN